MNERAADLRSDLEQTIDLGEGLALEAPIGSVAVYPDQARVTRRAVTTLSCGRHRLRVEQLPLGTVTDSIRVGGHGPATVLGVDVVYRRHSTTQDSVTEDLNVRRNQLQAALSETADAETVEHQRLAFLSDLSRRASGTYAQALARGESDIPATAALTSGIAAQSAETLAALRRLAREKKTTTEEIAAIDRTLGQRGKAVVADRLAAIIEVDVTSADTPIQLELSYLVAGARWSSTYDVRVDAERIAVTWYALVTQDTGEDWPECDLVLSTARPSATAAIPDLHPWYIGVPRFVGYGGTYGSQAPQNSQPPGQSAGPWLPTGENFELDAGLPLPSGPTRSQPIAVQPIAVQPVVEQVASVEHGMSAANYRSARPVAVPSDGGAHRATIAALDLTADLDYVTAPVEAEEAQLRASVVNTSDHTLLPGPAAIFSGSDFVGTTALETWAPGERIELALGVDDRLRVERKLVDRRVGKAIIGSTRHREVEYRTTITNHTPQTATVTVLDQVPISQHHTIVVREARIVPEPSERTELGILRWTLTLGSGQTTQISLRLRVDLPGDTELTGWRD